LPENRGVAPDIEAKRTLEQILKREDSPKEVAIKTVLAK
jgi:C-terminal processing protease CtpA/Prc